ncbi:hypothetical protein [Xanthomonas phage SB4]|uniref:Uncharacterized protein n=1 Tax=Xanthomonas phage SB4 TaxID=3117473 RepID=A0ABZ2GZC6_9CAUD
MPGVLLLAHVQWVLCKVRQMIHVFTTAQLLQLLAVAFIAGAGFGLALLLITIKREK